jgi:WD40 repeat protein
MLAAGYSRKRVGIWYTSTRKEDDSLASQYLEGHRGSVTSLSFSPNSDILAYGAADGSVRLWRCDGWDLLAVLHEASGDSWYTRRKNAFPGCVAFNPSGTLLATLADKGRVIKIWELDTETLLSMAPSTGTAHYANAKVVLAGNTGVGKTGLGRVLAGEPFAPTESTHGRHV